MGPRRNGEEAVCEMPTMQPAICSLFSGYLHKRRSRVDPLESGQSLSEGSTFTYQDVLEELISYTPHSDSGARSDEFRFSLSDGLYTRYGKVELAIELPRMELPRLTVNRGLQLPAGMEWIGVGWLNRLVGGGGATVLIAKLHLLSDKMNAPCVRNLMS